MNTGNSSNLNESVRGEWIESTSSYERVEDVLLNTRGPLSPPAIAEEAAVSAPTARKRLKRLVELGIANVEQTENGCHYWRNEMYGLTQRVLEIDNTYSKDELSENVSELKEELNRLLSALDSHEQIEANENVVSGPSSDGFQERLIIQNVEEVLQSKQYPELRTTFHNYLTALATLNLQKAEQS